LSHPYFSSSNILSYVHQGLCFYMPMKIIECLVCDRHYAKLHMHSVT
jgi:hypothetical protein